MELKKEIRTVGYLARGWGWSSSDGSECMGVLHLWDSASYFWAL